jgi:hypothetical protein
MAIADAFAAYLAARGYDPRSSRHSDFLSGIIVSDLVTNCQLIAARAALGQIVRISATTSRLGRTIGS